MGLFHRKSTFEKAISPITDVDAKAMLKSGATAVASVVALTAASAVVSAVRHKSEQ